MKIFQDDKTLIETEDFRTYTAKYNGYIRSGVSINPLFRKAGYSLKFFFLFEVEMDGVINRFVVETKSQRVKKWGSRTFLTPYTKNYKRITEFDVDVTPNKCTITSFTSALKDGVTIYTNNDGLVLDKEQEKTILKSMVKNCPILNVTKTFLDLRPAPSKTLDKASS
jgi:hypothetical protein